MPLVIVPSFPQLSSLFLFPWFVSQEVNLGAFGQVTGGDNEAHRATQFSQTQPLCTASCLEQHCRKERTYPLLPRGV